MGVASFSKRAIRKAKRMLKKEPPKKVEPVAPKRPPRKILLLTNRDSDNVGDQVIEACDIALISAAMENLFPGDPYKISSRAAAIVSKDYIKSRRPELLASARKSIAEADVLVFGGAPLFNYEYQIFSERTAVTLELARECGTPVLFSAIGVESYDEDRKECRRLKETLNFDVVKQITTRDDFDKLQKYREREDLVIGKVADPAVFSDVVFKKILPKPPAPPVQAAADNQIQSPPASGQETAKDQNPAAQAATKDQQPIPEKPKKIGIFVLREFGFKDNGVNFSGKEALDFWVDLMAEFEGRGYECEFLTSGHYGDEAFVDRLMRDCGVAGKKCVFNINAPEDLLKRIHSYSGVVSCRLHPGIISYALRVPAVGMVWNRKVTGFYGSIGHEDRLIYREDFEPAKVADRLEQAMEEGVCQEQDFRMSIYLTLFEGLRRCLEPADRALDQDPDDDGADKSGPAESGQTERGSAESGPDEGGQAAEIRPYSYEELLEKLPPYKGTSQAAQQEKLRRKFRRAYLGLNGKTETIKKLKQENAELKKTIKKLEQENKH